MKVLILTDQLGVGGAETHIVQLALELFRQGNEVYVASSGGKLADGLQKQGITHICLPLKSHSPLIWLILRHKIRKLIKRENIDIAHAHARIAATLIKGVHRLQCAEIVTVHAKFRAGMLHRLFSYWGDYSIAVSEDLRTYLHSVYGISTQRICVIPNGIELSRFSPTERRQHDFTRILFASRLDADCSRGAELLCEITPNLVKHIPNLRITIAGGGQKMDEIAQRAKEINLALGFECIFPSGSIQDMPSLLQEQDIFVGVSRAALEAAACGCSVILCGNEGYGGILTEETFWQASLTNFCARDAQKPHAQILLDDILRLVASTTLQQQNAMACRKLLEKYYDSTSVCQQTIDVYQKSLLHPPRATLAIGGYFGCGNLGDDAILQAFIEYTHTRYPDMRILALTKRPHKDKKRLGVDCYQRKWLFSLLAVFTRADAFLCGGGSLLQNITGKFSVYYYLCMLRLAKLCGALPVLYAAGIGPLHGKRAEIAVQKTLSRCAYISLRDIDSLHFLQAKRIDSAKLHLGADMALLLTPPPISRTYALLKRIDVAQNCRYVCVCLKADKLSFDNCCTIVAAVRMLCREHNLLPVFMPLDQSDLSINKAGAQKLGGKCFVAEEPRDVTALLRNAQFLISMRLHGLILATTVSLPTLGISTSGDQKIPSFARLSAQEHLAPEKISVATIVEICQAFCSRKEALRPLIADACRDLQKNAQKDLANIVAMVYNKSRYIKKSEDTL